MKIKYERIVTITERCCKLAFKQIISSSDVDRVTAMTLAKDAADALGNSLLRDLPEWGVEIEPWKALQVLPEKVGKP
jgi:hypothetical protein